MAEENNNGGASNNQNLNNNNGGSGGGTDPKQPVTQAPTSVDITKIGDDDFAKVFDDPRLWKHPRFQTLNDKAKEAETLRQAQITAEQTKLAEQGKFKELAEASKAEAEQLKEKFTRSQTDNRITIEASKAGVVDVEAVLALIDRSKISIDSNGIITGADTAITELLNSKPYLKKGNTTTIGGGTNPGGDNNVVKFKMSQLKDASFYQAHEAEIREAKKNGQIENDLGPNG